MKCLESKKKELETDLVPGGEYFLVKDYWGCAAGWGRIFTNGLTIFYMGMF